MGLQLKFINDNSNLNIDEVFTNLRDKIQSKEIERPTPWLVQGVYVRQFFSINELVTRHDIL